MPTELDSRHPPEKATIAPLLGALTIGQAPRPDLLGPLLAAYPGFRWLEAGALDNMTPGWRPAEIAGYPLRTQLRDGTTIIVSEPLLAPLLQEALARLASGGAALVLLLCAGTFSTLQSTSVPLLHPFRLALAALRATGCRRPLLLVPIEAQAGPTARRYQDEGFTATAWAAPLAPGTKGFDAGLDAALGAHEADALLVDYVGHPPAALAALRQTVDRPVFALDTLLLHALQQHLAGGVP